MAEDNKPEVSRGLKDICFDRSPTTYIDGRAGDLRYCGYSIHDLATHSSFEETAYLLLNAQLPSAAELAHFDQQLKQARQVPSAIFDIIRSARDGHPMDVLRTCVSALAVFDEDATDNSPEATMRKGIRLSSQVPLMVAAHHRIRNDLEPVAPDNTLGHAANWLYMITGEKPSDDTARLMDIDMVLHAEHGSNASAFTARVVVSTEANLHAAMTAAIAALSGPAHGGAAENVMHMAQEIGEPEKAAAYVKAKRKNREPIMGFGHRVYRAEDPRARHMREGVKRLSEEMGEPRWYAILEALTEAMAPYSRHGVNVNVDFYAGVVYFLNGIPADLFVPIFAVGRVPGWTVQAMEQFENNILIRPRLLYTGPDLREYVPIDER